MSYIACTLIAQCASRNSKARRKLANQNSSLGRKQTLYLLQGYHIASHRSVNNAVHTGLVRVHLVPLWHVHLKKRSVWLRNARQEGDTTISISLHFSSNARFSSAVICLSGHGV